MIASILGFSITKVGLSILVSRSNNFSSSPVTLLLFFISQHFYLTISWCNFSFSSYLLIQSLRMILILLRSSSTILEMAKKQESLIFCTVFETSLKLRICYVSISSKRSYPCLSLFLTTLLNSYCCLNVTGLLLAWLYSIPPSYWPLMVSCRALWFLVFRFGFIYLFNCYLLF